MTDLEAGARRAYLAHTHPSIDDVSEEGIAWLVFSVVYQSGEAMDSGGIRKQLSSSYGINIEFKDLIVGALDYLQQRDLLQASGEGWTLTDLGEEEGRKREDRKDRVLEGALRDFLDQYESDHGALPRDEEHVVKKALERALIVTAESLGEELRAFFGPEFSPQKLDIDSLETEVRDEIRSQHGEDIAQEVVSTFSYVLHNPTDDFSSLFARLTESFSLGVALQVDPEITEWRKDFISDMETYIDTNVVIALLNEENHYHSDVWAALEILSDHNADLRISDTTRKEFSDTLSYAEDIWEELKEGEGSIQGLNHEMVLQFQRTSEDYESFADFRESILRQYDQIVETLGIDTVTLESVDKEDAVRAIITSEIDDRGEFQTRHDARIISHVHSKRAEKGLPLGAPWYLSLDRELPALDEDIRDFLEAPPRPALATPDTFLELVAPFSAPEADYEKFLTRLVGRQLSPYDESVQYQEFLGYVERQLGEQTRDNLESYISNHHLERSIKEEFDEGDTEKAVGQLLEAVAGSETLDQQEKVDRLVDRLRNLQGDSSSAGGLPELLGPTIEKQYNVTISRMEGGVVAQGDEMEIENDLRSDIDDLKVAVAELAPKYSDELGQKIDEIDPDNPGKSLSVVDELRSMVNNNQGVISASGILLSHLDKIEQGLRLLLSGP